MVTTRRRWTLAGVLTVAAVAWLPLNKAVEGPKLLVLSRNHAIVTGDLLSVLLVLIAAVLVLPRRDGPRVTP